MLYLHVCSIVIFQIDNTTDTIIFYLQNLKYT